MFPWMVLGLVSLISLVIVPRVIVAMMRRAWVLEDEERRGCDRMETESLEEIRELRWKAFLLQEAFKAYEDGDDLGELMEDLIRKENARQRLTRN
jgi:hypothetical protein